MTQRFSISQCVMVISLFFLFGGGCQFPQTTDDSWVLAALPFLFQQHREYSPAERAIATELPALILEQLTGGLERTLLAAEIHDRTVYDLQQKRKALFLQLSQKVQERDTLVLGGYSEREFRRRRASVDKQIAALQKQIEDNLAASVFPMEESVPKKKSPPPETASVRLYKDDSTALFLPNDGEDERQLRMRIRTAQIDAVLTGTVSLFAGYVSCTVQLSVYPGARTVATVSDVGSVQQLTQLAEHLARQIQPAVTNSMPVTLSFSVEPTATAVSLLLDDIVYTNVPESLVISAGVHSLLFSADGHRSAGISYAFTGHRAFSVSVSLVPATAGTASVRLTEPLAGSFYINGRETPSDDGGQTARIAINGQPVLGQFITDDGQAISFFVPQTIIADGQTFSVSARAYDRNAVIEKRRRHMYTAYSILIVSLVPTFYTYGTYTAEAFAYTNGAGNYERARNWQIASSVSASVSIGAAAFFVFELVRYLIAANAVLPTAAKRAADNYVPVQPAVTDETAAVADD